MTAVRRALVSVADKTGIVEFARRLTDTGVELVSSGGTAAALDEAGVPVTLVEAVTGAPEMLGGRVKTLHPAIHGGILADPSDDAHRADLEAHDLETFELVVCNLYPFEDAVAAGATPDEAIEQIDIGGVALLRAAAKNHRAVAVVSSPDQYDRVAEAVENGTIGEDLRTELAQAAFFRTASYDAAILAWLHREEALPPAVVLPLQRTATLRYGENPHQEAAAYASGTGWWTEARQLQGKQLSYNNLVDADAAWRLVNDLASPAAVVVKHTNACGAAQAPSVAEALSAAWDGDPLAAFGGVVAVNAPLTEEAAAFLSDRFVEVVVAPAVEPEAAVALAKKTSLRVVEATAPSGTMAMRGIDGAVLLQTRDEAVSDHAGWSHVAGPDPSPAMLADLSLAWAVAAHTSSNAIVVVADGAAVGVGGGDQSRVGAAERALHKAGDRARGAVAASDAFFPFRDGLDTLAGAGVVAVVQPGGSRRDDEVVAAADEHGVTMMVTGRRHFRH